LYLPSFLLWGVGGKREGVMNQVGYSEKREDTKRSIWSL
jgi:hypothetical protein